MDFYTLVHVVHPCSVLGIIHRYKSLKAMSPEERKNAVPRVCVIGGKAAPGYDIAKRIIKLVRVATGPCIVTIHDRNDHLCDGYVQIHLTSSLDPT